MEVFLETHEYVQFVVTDLCKGEITMINKKFIMIPVLIAALLIPQLLFWWLVPEDIVARMVIYIGGTILTLLAGVALFITYWNANIRKISGLVVLVSVLEIAVIVICSLMVMLNVTIRSAIFALVIMGLVHLVCMIPMIASILKSEVVEVVPITVPTEESCTKDRDINQGGSVATNRAKSMITRREMPSGNTSGLVRKAMPPRNR